MRLAAAIAISLLAAACVPKDMSANPLAGSEWRFVEIDDLPPAQPDKALLSFGEHDLQASVGCNRMQGPGQIEQGHLQAGPITTTEMACPGPVSDEEIALSALLVASPDAVIDDDLLVLRSASHNAELKRVSPLRPAQ